MIIGTLFNGLSNLLAWILEYVVMWFPGCHFWTWLVLVLIVSSIVGRTFWHGVGLVIGCYIAVGAICLIGSVLCEALSTMPI